MTDFLLDDNHKYWLKGQQIPGVTEVLSDLGITDLSMVRKEILEHKAASGVSLHEITSKWDQGILDITALNPVHLPNFEAYVKFEDDFGIEMIATEYCSYSSKWKYGFTIDLIARITKGKYAGKVAIIDKKSGTYLNGVRYQLGAYQEGWNDLETEKASVRLCVQLIDGKYKVYPFTGKSDGREFLALLEAYKLKHRG